MPTGTGSAGSPAISVVMATYGRGRHILPSIRSVQGQNFRDWELIVAGDACSDETEAVVRAVPDDRVRWLNLSERVGSQSGPNNAGLAAALGRHVAYLGHDDIWDPTHLERLLALLDADPPADFAVSGTIYHPPNGMPGGRVTGLFYHDYAKHSQFFPPSSFAHRRDVVQAIGLWRMPMEIRPPVDEEFLMRAAAADLRFVSTRVVTVHKFAAGLRYLSYVEQHSDEQEAMLADLGAPDLAERIALRLEQSRRQGEFMNAYEKNFDSHEPGRLARDNLSRKGLLRRSTSPLERPVTIRHRTEPAAYDWRETPVLGIRWAKVNPRPRLLLPVTRQGMARLQFDLVHRDRAGLGEVGLACNGAETVAPPRRLRRSIWGWRASYEAELPLKAEGPSVLELRLTGLQVPAPPRRGIGIGPLRLAPAVQSKVG